MGEITLPTKITEKTKMILGTKKIIKNKFPTLIFHITNNLNIRIDTHLYYLSIEDLEFIIMEMKNLRIDLEGA